MIDTTHENGAVKYTFTDDSLILTTQAKIEAQIKSLEDAIQDIKIRVDIANQDIKANKAKINILKGYLNDQKSST